MYKPLRMLGVLLCLSTGHAAFGREPLNTLSTRQEIELGKQLSAEIEKKEKLLADPEIQAYIGDIGWRIAHVSPRQDVQCTFKVIDASDTVNAFALPGGFMYVYTGLMELCENEAELAAVMAHEMGHVAGRHHGEMITRMKMYDTVTRVLLGKHPNEVAQILAALTGVTGAMYFSRENEREADGLGMEFLFCAGYRPDALLTFMDKMDAEQRRRGGIWLPILSSHPRTPGRIALLNALIQKYPPDLRANSPVYAERYREKVLNRLK